MLIEPSVQILALKNNPPRHPTVCQRTWAQKPWVQVVEHSDRRGWRHCDHPQQVILFITKDWPGCEPGIYFATFYLLLARPFTTWLLRPPRGYYLNLKAPLSLFVSIFIVCSRSSHPYLHPDAQMINWLIEKRKKTRHSVLTSSMLNWGKFQDLEKKEVWIYCPL